MKEMLIIFSIETLKLFLVALIGFSGQIIGNILAKISPEEMKPGNKYFRFFEVFFIGVIVLLSSVLLIKFNFLTAIVVLLGIVAGLFFRKIYGWLSGVLFSFSGYLFVFSSLIFIYGLFYGTLNRPFKNLKKMVFDFGLFFIIGGIIWFFDLNIIGFFIGGLISQIYVKLAK